MIPQLIIRTRATADSLTVEFQFAGSIPTSAALFVASAPMPDSGGAVTPFGKDQEGSTIFLPFRATRMVGLRQTPHGTVVWQRTHNSWRWTDREAVTAPLSVTLDAANGTAQIAFPLVAGQPSSRWAAWCKDLGTNDGWGSLVADGTPFHGTGTDDQTIHGGWEVRATENGAQCNPIWRTPIERIRIYQLMPRLFGNQVAVRKPWGTKEENGCGTFDDIDSTALRALRQMGFTDIWATGVIDHATGTDYSSLGKPADHATLLKGRAGSPYAIRDYFDIAPDLARDPAERREAFARFVRRAHDAGLRVLIDFVPNHVARTYRSTVMPEADFGRNDNPQQFFSPNNNFYPLHGQPLRLPTMNGDAAAAVICPQEALHARVSGNNVTSPAPSMNDWYETVKLNYGYHFADPTAPREHPSALDPTRPVPDTWRKMDAVLAYWQQSFGVDGFRCDMAHMIPNEFWQWALPRARGRNPDTLFIAEAYDNDPAKVPSTDPLLRALNQQRGHVMLDLLAAGFTAVYDDPTYKAAKHLHDGGGWANDIDHARAPAFVFENSLRYLENHDEVRLGAPGHWGGVGITAGPALAAVLYAISGGPILFYHGQEVGERGADAAGFASGNGRTTIFDYWGLEEHQKWVNHGAYDGGQLTPDQRALRTAYQRVLQASAHPALRFGDYVPLNPGNIANPLAGRAAGETASGHWLVAFARHHVAERCAIFVVANLDPANSLTDLALFLPPTLSGMAGPLTDLLGTVTGATITTDGLLRIPAIPAARGAWLLARLPGVAINTAIPMD
jgi:glycosidase